MGNIVKAVVGKNGKTIKTAPLYQYDYGQILQIEGIELPEAYQVHFSNDQTGDSTTSIGNENGVAIPDTYLASGETVYAWLYLHTGEDDGETVLNIVIPVRQRAAITNETPTPQQQSEIDQIIEELNEAVDAAEDAQAAAEEAAEQAEAQVEKYPVIVDGYWAFWDEADEQYVKSNQKAQGPQGEPGDPGDPTELIDDTTQAANKTYSSNKIEAELTPLKSALTAVQNDVYTNIWTPETLTLTDGVYYMPTGKPSTYSSAKSSAAVAVTVGDVLKVTAKTQANVPGIIFYNSSTLSTDTFVSYDCYTGSTQQYVDEPVTVPTGAKYAIVQGLKANDVILKTPEKAAKFDKYDTDIANIQDNDSYMTNLFCNRMMAIGKPSGFSWGSRPKFIMSIRVDDLRTDVDKVAKIIMGEYQFPMMIAACVKELNKTVTGITDPAEKIGDTRLEVCQWVQQHGGEILVHPNETVTTADYNTSVKPLFLDARKVLEDNGIRIRGTAVANATPNATLKAGLDPYMYGYFDYSDGYGSIAPYADITTTMIGGWGSDVSQFTSWLNGRIASTSWRTLVIHELGDDVTEQALRDMLDIIATHVQNEDMILANWSTVYDTYGTH